MSRHHHRLHRRKWERARIACLDRDGWRCQTCGRWGNEADHVVPLERGGAPYDMGNLQTLCRGCHIAKTRDENRREPTTAETAWRALILERMNG